VSAFEAFLEGAVRTATPLAFAALGETVVERSGVINIGLEGAIIAGAFGGFVAAGSGSIWLGMVGSAIAGILVAAAFAIITIRIRADQIITGTAISLICLGFTAMLYQQIYGATGAALSIPTMAATEVPLLVSIPLFGRALFAQPAITYVLYLIIPVVWWWMYHTHAGLAVRATGEDPCCDRGWNSCATYSGLVCAFRWCNGWNRRWCACDCAGWFICGGDVSRPRIHCHRDCRSGPMASTRCCGSCTDLRCSECSSIFLPGSRLARSISVIPCAAVRADIVRSRRYRRKGSCASESRTLA